MNTLFIGFVCLCLLAEFAGAIRFLFLLALGILRLCWSWA